MSEVELTRSERGFNRGPEIEGHYGGAIVAYESSGDTPCLWVSIREPDDLNVAVIHKHNPDTPEPTYHDATILLTIADVDQLIATLTALRNDHFLRGSTWDDAHDASTEADEPGDDDWMDVHEE